MSEYQLIIDGQRVSSPTTFAVLNPADESTVADCPQGTVEQLDEAVAAAKRAFPGWAALPDAQRVQMLNEIADRIDAQKLELAQLITQEQGKSLNGPGSRFEVGGAAAWTRVTAGLELPVEVLQDDEQGKIEIHRRPVGVVGSITPWNWPFIIAAWHIMPALRVGCTLVIKPSPFTPLSTLKLVEIINEVVPAGVVNVVTGDADVGNRMSTHPDIDKIVFTGSIATGKHVMKNASDSLKRLTLELGGNDAGIILPGTDIASKIDGLFWGCFINAGQTCAALKRLYVHEDQYEEVTSALVNYIANVKVGPGLDEDTAIGPLSNKMQFEKVAAMVEEARAEGARVLCGGDPAETPGYFYPLTVLADVTDEMRIVREEQFGTVIPVLKYSDLDDAVERANALEVGLGGSAWGDDIAAATAVAQRLKCGTAWVNQHGALNPLAPFGGVKCSGMGVQFNVDGLREYTTVQVVNVAA